jgi:hypothetical protein
LPRGGIRSRKQCLIDRIEAEGAAKMRKLLVSIVLGLALIAAPRIAMAHVGVSIGIGLPFPVLAPPVAYAPPVVYAPPVAYGPPPVVYGGYYGPPVVYGRAYGPWPVYARYPGRYWHRHYHGRPYHY